MNAPMTQPRGWFPAGLLPAPAEAEARGPDVGNLIHLAYGLVALFVLVFALWSWAAPLNSAAVAQGILEAEGGGRRTVQHLEGGIIQKFLVAEGQKVKIGEPLVQLDRTQADARGATVRSAYYTLLAQDARLTAERLGSNSVSYPAEMIARQNDPEIASIIASSDTVFKSRRRALAEQIAILNQRVGQTSAEIESTNAQMAALADQSRLLDTETKAVSALVAEGLERNSRLLGLQRQQAAFVGQHGQLTGNIARLNDAKGEMRAQMALLQGQMATDAAAQQREVRLSLVDAREKMIVATDINARQQIVAPIAGTVANLRLITPGAVLGSGQPLLDIVPSYEKILVNARLNANDIDIVHVGMNAEVRLTPYKARVLPMLRGEVRKVSPDATFDEQTRALYYRVTIELDTSEIDHIEGVQLISGMPAEVFIDTGSRSLLQYLVQPLFDSFHRAFRES